VAARTTEGEALVTDFLSLNVNEHTEKKGNLTYLSWAWAWAEVLRDHPEAVWVLTEYADANGVRQPCMWLPDGTAIVKVVVTIDEVTKSAVLPVMDNKNHAIQNPDAFAINTAIMRCLAKACAMFGLGLYIYAGEDVPEGESAPAKERTPRPAAPPSKPLDQHPAASTPSPSFDAEDGEGTPRCACGLRVYKTGTSAKSGDPWAGWMCASNPGKCPPQWIDLKQPAGRVTAPTLEEIPF
jgi:hypothetical protein